MCYKLNHVVFVCACDLDKDLIIIYDLNFPPSSTTTCSKMYLLKRISLGDIFVNTHKSKSPNAQMSSHAHKLTRLASSSAFSSSVLSSRETCVGPNTDGEPFPLQSLCSVGRKWPREGGLELCMLAERYR